MTTPVLSVRPHAHPSAVSTKNNHFSKSSGGITFFPSKNRQSVSLNKSPMCTNPPSPSVPSTPPFSFLKRHRYSNANEPVFLPCDGIDIRFLTKYATSYFGAEVSLKVATNADTGEEGYVLSGTSVSLSPELIALLKERSKYEKERMKQVTESEYREKLDRSWVVHDRYLQEEKKRLDREKRSSEIPWLGGRPPRPPAYEDTEALIDINDGARIVLEDSEQSGRGETPLEGSIEIVGRTNANMFGSEAGHMYGSSRAADNQRTYLSPNVQSCGPRVNMRPRPASCPPEVDILYAERITAMLQCSSDPSTAVTPSPLSPSRLSTTSTLTSQPSKSTDYLLENMQRETSAPSTQQHTYKPYRPPTNLLPQNPNHTANPNSYQHHNGDGDTRRQYLSPTYHQGYRLASRSVGSADFVFVPYSVAAHRSHGNNGAGAEGSTRNSIASQMRGDNVLRNEGDQERHIAAPVRYADGRPIWC